MSSRAIHPLLSALADAMKATETGRLSSPPGLRARESEARLDWLAAGAPKVSTLALTCSRCEDELREEG